MAELAAARDALVDQVTALRSDLERQRAAAAAAVAERNVARFERDTLEVQMHHAQDGWEAICDAFVAERDGLAAIAADPAIDAARRIAVCEQHILKGRIDQVEALLDGLRGRPEHGAFVERGRSLCGHLRRSGILDALERVSGAGTSAGPYRLPLLYRAPAADKIVLLFKGNDSRFWMNFEQLFQALKPFGQHLVFLKDDRMRSFMHGIDGLAAGYQESLSELRALCRSLGDLPIYCIGGSTGGFGALRYGLDLGAEAVLGFSPWTTLAPDIADRPVVEDSWIGRYIGADAIDLKPHYDAAAARFPRLTLYHGENNSRDAMHVHRLADRPGVRVVSLPGYGGHDVFFYLLAHQQLDAVLTAFLTGAPGVKN